MAIPGTTFSQVLHLNCSLKLLHEVLANTTVYISVSCRLHLCSLCYQELAG